MGTILQKSMLKCIDSNNKEGITFLEVVVVGILFPFLVKKTVLTFKYILKH